MATIPPVEILEASYPVMFTQWALRQGSGGAGLHRGGLGAIYELETLTEKPAEVFLLGERAFFPPFGVNGGGPGALNRFIFTVGDEERSPPARRQDHRRRLEQGQKGSDWRRRAAAAGGDPAKRPVEQVMRDIRLGYIAAGDAALYAIALSTDGALDETATALLRGRIA